MHHAQASVSSNEILFTIAKIIKQCGAIDLSQPGTGLFRSIYFRLLLNAKTHC